MVMHDEDPLDGAAHTKVFIVVLQPLQTRGDGWVFLRLRFLGAVEKGKKKNQEYVCVSFEVCGESELLEGESRAHLNVKFERGYL